MTAPKKNVKINGGMKMKPEYKKWKEAQSGGAPATSVANPSQAPPIISSMNDHEELNENVVAAGGTEILLEESTNATIEMMQEPKIPVEAGSNPDTVVDEVAVMNPNDSDATDVTTDEELGGILVAESGISTNSSTGRNDTTSSAGDDVANEDEATAFFSSALNEAMTFFSSALNEAMTFFSPALACLSPIFNLFALLVVFDMLFDVYVIIKWFTQEWYWFASGAFVIVISNWRFAMLFSAINPKITVSNLVYLYVPFVFVSKPDVYHSIVKVDTQPVEAIQHDDSSEPHLPVVEETPAVVPFDPSEPHQPAEETPAVVVPFRVQDFLFETAKVRYWQGVVRGKLDRRIRTIKKSKGMRRGLLRLLLELHLLCISLICGPFFIGMASLQLAFRCGQHQPNVRLEPQRMELQILLNKFVVVVEACFESLPQLFLTLVGNLYSFDKPFPTPFYIVSFTLSISAIAYAFGEFFWYRKEILAALRPMRIAAMAGRRGDAVDEVTFTFNDGSKNSFGYSVGGGELYEASS
jgi:hypothetical protein